MPMVADKTALEFVPGFEMHRLLGRSGSAEVWEATSETGRAVALKLLPYQNLTAASDDTRAIQLVRQLRHTGLAHIEEVRWSAGYLVVASELADGSLMDLAEVYKKELQSNIPPD